MSPDFTGWALIAFKVVLAGVLGGSVGLEREWTGKWAGLRTHTLIAVGAALITQVSIEIGPRFADGSNAWDPGRIAAQIVSGIGFLGAGTILQSRGTVRGLTTAAGLWVAAGIGMAVGASFYAVAILGTLALLITLAVLRPLEKRILRSRRRCVVFELESVRHLDDLLHLLSAAGLDEREVAIDGEPDGSLRIEVRFLGSEAKESDLRTLASARGIPGAEA
jgi:putative Mg2+ transporter-C (MgtC) family protein